MQEPDRAPPAVKREGAHKKVVGAEHVRGDEVAGTGDAVVDVRLGRQVHDRIGAKVREESRDSLCIPDINPLESIPSGIRESGNVCRISGIGEGIEVEYFNVGEFGKQVMNQVRPNEPTASGNQNPLHAPTSGPRAAWSVTFASE